MHPRRRVTRMGRTLWLSAWLFVSGGMTQPLQPAGALGPRRWIELRQSAVQGQLRDRPPGAVRDATVSAIFNGMLDVSDLSRRALEPNWSQRTEAERREFVELLGQLIEHNYRSNLDQTLNYQVTFEPEQVAADGQSATVRTVARSRTDLRAATVTVEYRLHRRASEWAVHDLVTNGSSLVQSYHDSYSRIIRDRGFPELLTRMRARIAALHTVRPQTPPRP